MKFRLASGLSLIVACSLVPPACSSIRMPHVWPFYKKPKPAPEAVLELNLVNADGSAASFPQYWKRNTLVIDLSGAGGAGSVRGPPSRRNHLAGAAGRTGASGQRRTDRNPGRRTQRAAGQQRRHGEHRPRTGAQRVHAEDGGYLHFLGADAGIRRDGAGGSRARIRVTDGSAEACSGSRKTAPSASDIIAPAEAQPAQPSPPPGS